MENTAQNNAKIKTKDAAQTDKILHEKFVLYGRNAREWTRKCALLLPEIAKHRIWEKKGFENIYEYARILAGISRASVDDTLWVGRKIEDKPALKQVAEEKGINAIKPVVSIATVSTESFWAEKAKEMSKHTLEIYVREFKKAHPEAKNNSDFLPGKFFSQNQNLFSEIKTKEITMSLDAEIADQIEKLKGQGDYNELMKKFLALYKEKLEENKPVPVENAKRYVPVAIKQHALAKTNGTCAFPGCTRPHEILHHTKRFALTHSHDPNKLVPLCKAHERLAHHGLIENENTPPSEWRVRTTPDRTDKKYLIDQKVIKFRAQYG